MANVDILIIGAGHNGLVAASYLARAGKSVLVLEQRDIAGGQLVPSGPQALHASAQLRPDIARELGVAVPAAGSPAPYVSLLPDGGTLRLSSAPNDDATLQSVRAFAECGVDRISIGALTHSAKALDLSMLVEGLS